MTALRFGHSAVIEFDHSSAPRVVACEIPRGLPLIDLPSAVAAAISQPLDFPPLVRATVPGDKVVLAVDPLVPCVAAIVGTILDALLSHGIEAADITILRSGSASDSPRYSSDDRLEALRGRVAICDHDATNAEQHCHLINRPNGDEIRIHRQLFHADVIIPIGTLRAASAWDYFGVHTTLFPAFADAATQRAFREPLQADRKPSTDKQSSRKKKIGLVNEVAAELGVAFTVQVVPGPGESVMHIVAGESRSAARQGERLRREAWRLNVTETHELVVLGLTGPQTWENLTSAVVAAAPLVATNGAAAICSELAEPPTEALRALAHCDDRAKMLRRLKKMNVPDAPLAARLFRAIEGTKLYLLSQLSEDAVEDLGMAHVADPADIVRLARRAGSCLIVPDAQFADPHFAEAAEETTE